MKRLKGPKGSEVKLGVFRPGEKETLHFTIVRGDIPVKSVDAAYMLNDKFGYIKVNKFGETTYPELLISLAKLNQANCEGVVIDLRGYTGGYMGAAIQMVNEFLPKNRLIVYTQGRKSPRENYTSNGTGSSQKMPIVVLMDEGSASASEIFAGAIQDNDRRDNHRAPLFRKRASTTAYRLQRWFSHPSDNCPLLILRQDAVYKNRM